MENFINSQYTKRFNTKKIKVGSTYIGGGSDVLVQTMLFKSPDDIKANVKQAIETEKAGAEILRVAIPNKNAIALIEAIKSKISIPLVADIHFDYRLAILAAEAGIDKIRINPGNIGGDDRVKAVAKICNEKNIPIRIGVNSGSLEKEILKIHGKTADALVASGLYHAKLLNKFDFDNIIISIKSSNVKTMVEAYRKMAMVSDYPLHLGVTEAGTFNMGIIKSSIGIGSLLLDDIGDTLRVTLTEELDKEIKAGHDILRGAGIKKGVDIISCPTCGRTSINLFSLVKKVEKLLENETKDIQVAVMGCVVNGPGEASGADIGVAASGKQVVLFKKGKVIGKYEEDQIIDVLRSEIKKM